MKTQIPLVRKHRLYSSVKPRKMKAWPRKMKKKMQPAVKLQKRKMLAVLVVVGILDSKPIKDVDTWLLKLDDDELQGDVENQENEAERLQYL